MAGRYGITRGTPRGGHGGAPATSFTTSSMPRKKKTRAAKHRRVRNARKAFRRAPTRR